VDLCEAGIGQGSLDASVNGGVRVAQQQSKTLRHHAGV
jgi:hypothetical protein